MNLLQFKIVHNNCVILGKILLHSHLIAFFLLKLLVATWNTKASDSDIKTIKPSKVQKRLKIRLMYLRDNIEKEQIHFFLIKNGNNGFPYMAALI